MVIGYKLQAYHWNVEGLHFPMYHKLFGDLYETVADSIDVFAEKMRSAGFTPPVSFAEILKTCTAIEDNMVQRSGSIMIVNLIQANQAYIDSLKLAFKFAEVEGNQSLMDFLAGVLGDQEKMQWFLKSSNGPVS